MNSKDLLRNERSRLFGAVKIAIANAEHCFRRARTALDRELTRELDRIGADYALSAGRLLRASNREALRFFAE